jgi:gamma-glutamylcyclotransferase (GGCT)/AIG2-like uncharacterized protein YtfP
LSAAALYTAGPYPFLVRAADLVPQNATVFGELIDVNPARYQHILALLDELEDYVPGRADNLYERVELPVQTVDGTRSAWVYVAGAAVEAAIRRGELRLIERGEW